MPDWQRVFHSREEVHEYKEQWARQATLVGVPGSSGNAHRPGAGVGLAMAAQIVEAVSGMTFWDYMHEHVFGRAGMTGSAFYTRDQWLTDEHIAHPYMRQADGSRVDAVRNLDKGSLGPQAPDRNPGRSFIGHASGEGFATAPDLVRFAEALADGTLLDRPYADLFAGAKLPSPGGPTSFHAYSGPVHIINGRQWTFSRGGGGGGISANWNVYPDTGWVGVVFSNYDDLQEFGDILQKEQEAITGQPVDPPGGG
jgi:CubicO group peptidase (beta-lactamase class C family)